MSSSPEEMSKRGSRGLGVILSYVAVILTAASNFVLIPFYIRTLGSDAYGLYEYVYSIASYAMILDFGISNVMIRYITEYRVKKDKHAEENFSAHVLLITAIAVMIIAVSGMILYTNINQIVVNRTSEEMTVARGIFVCMILRIILAIVQHFFDGALLSYEHYIEAKGIACARILIKLITIISLVLFSQSVYGIVIGDVLASLICLLISFFFTVKMKFKIKWHFFDKVLFRSVFFLIGALILQSIVTFANNALGKYIVGTYLSNTMVTVYAVALSLNEVFQTIAIAVNPVFMPKVTKIMADGADREKITDVVIQIGRLQCILCLGIIAGFFVIGKHFLILWSGPETVAAWLPALLLMLSGLIPLVQSTCLSVLTVYNKRMFRSIVLLAIIPLNLLLGIFLVEKIGILGVAIGAFVALILGNGIIMNVYYYKVIKLNIFRMLREIFSGILPSALCATVGGTAVAVLLDGTLGLVVEAIVFCVIYMITLWLFGLHKEERAYVANFLYRVVPKK